MTVTHEADRLFSRVFEHFERELARRGNPAQEPNKRDLFRIFSEAYRGGFCGRRLRATKDESAQKIWVRATSKRPQISGDVIKSLARKQGLIPTEASGDEPEYRLLEKLCSWWDEWCYAWDHNPPKRRYVRRSN